MGQLVGQQSDNVPQRVADGGLQGQDVGQRVQQPVPDVTGEPVGAAEENSRPGVVRLCAVGVPGPELIGFQAVGAGLVPDVMVSPAAHEGPLAGDQLYRAAAVVEPHPAPAADHGVDGELDGADQP